MGLRQSTDGPCVYRLEQMNYDEASKQCAARGGRLFNAHNKRDLELVATLYDHRRRRRTNKVMGGLGIRDFGWMDWRFDGSNENATSAFYNITAGLKIGDRILDN